MTKKTAAQVVRVAVTILVCFRFNSGANHLRHSTLRGRVILMMMPHRRLVLHRKSLEGGRARVNPENPFRSQGYSFFSTGLLLESSWVSR